VTNGVRLAFAERKNRMLCIGVLNPPRVDSQLDFGRHEK
jgi:hypothetical protein